MRSCGGVARGRWRRRRRHRSRCLAGNLEDADADSTLETRATRTRPTRRRTQVRRTPRDTLASASPRVGVAARRMMIRVDASASIGRRRRVTTETALVRARRHAARRRRRRERPHHRHRPALDVFSSRARVETTANVLWITDRTSRPRDARVECDARRASLERQRAPRARRRR